MRTIRSKICKLSETLRYAGTSTEDTVQEAKTVHSFMHILETNLRYAETSIEENVQEDEIALMGTNT
jgi:hypothetical protein